MDATKVQQLANDMKKSMDAMLEMHNKAIASIPAEYGTLKEQIMNDFKNGLLDAWNNGNKWDYDEAEYYNQTYNQNK